MHTIAVSTEYDFRSREYAELFGRSAATAFQHPLWLAHVYGQLAPLRGGEPLIVTVRDGGGRLLMLLPLVRRRYGLLRVIEFADFSVADYTAPVSAPADLATLLADKGLSAGIRRALRPFDLLRITKLPDATPPIERLFRTAPRAPMSMHAYAVPLAAPYEDWRTSRLNASYRKELDKKARQLQRKGTVRFELCETPEQVSSTFAAMREYRRIRFGGTGGDLLQQDDYFEFYRNLAVEGRGTFVRTYVLTVDGLPVACNVGLSLRGHCLIILGGFDQAGYKNLSIGALMFEQVARDCIARGDTVLDFTIGDEPYKITFGADRSAMWMIAGSGSPMGSAANAAVHHLPWARSFARRLVTGYRSGSAAEVSGE